MKHDIVFRADPKADSPFEHSAGYERAAKALEAVQTVYPAKNQSQDWVGCLFKSDEELDKEACERLVSAPDVVHAWFNIVDNDYDNAYYTVGPAF